ncbi:MAG: beta-galactosidase [Terracidiphilus sp.]|jgi:hypothetical protein
MSMVLFTEKIEQKRRSIRLVLFALIAALLPMHSAAKAVVFWQAGFPTVASQPIERSSLEQALEGMDAQFVDMESLNKPSVLTDADLLILPYGSTFPCGAWKAIESYLTSGGNLLVIGGQPFHVPVTETDGKFAESSPQDAYSRVLDFRHTHEVPVPADARFAWKFGYDLPQTPQIRARRFFAVEGQLDGFGYMLDGTGLRVAAPVIVAERTAGSRIVALDFEPEPGYWQSGDGIALIHQSAVYARAGATEFTLETLFSTVRPGEPQLITMHLRNMRQERIGNSVIGEIKFTLSSENEILDSATLPITHRGIADVVAPFHRPLQPGFYRVSAVYSEQGQLRAFYQNGFWVEETKALTSGPTLGVRGDFLTRDDAPFFPVGTNYFTTEENGWDFSSPRNAWVWDQDFKEMSEHGVSLVRTGVWMANGRFIEGSTGGVSERFLRNLEAFLLCAQRHKIAVNFTFFAFTPRSGSSGREDSESTPPNPYTDPASIRAQQDYVRSVVDRFKDVQWLSWDLINEPSFSNPRHIFRGNYPNGDWSEIAAWRKWLRQKYDGRLPALADAWRVPTEQLGSFDSVPLPTVADLAPQRYGNANEVRAVDYNLFAQKIFSDWVRSMVSLIRATGSKQLIDVGQDEGGVTDRVLNQFYAGAGLSFTTNHTYWQDDALFWDSLAAKRPGMPNITGETGYQPSWDPDGAWRYDEFTGLGLTERKWALGFAAGSTGAMQWDWDREVDFGMKRSDGSAKVWVNQMHDLGEFARKAAPLATGLTLPEVALILPQSFQMSAGNSLALEAQKNAVRALYGYARSEAYAVGEYQTELLGTPKLILLPSPSALSQNAWQAIEERVKAGAVLLVTGPFDGDAHFHRTGRQDAIGLPYRTEALTIRDYLFHFPGGEERLSFSGSKTTVLNRAISPNGEDWIEKPLGSGRILFSALPLELNDNLQALGDIYRYALKAARVRPAYTTELNDPGILICPTQFPTSTLYVLTSESNQGRVSFEDGRSATQFTGRLASGEASILLVGTDGKLLSTYNWTPQ